MVLCATALSGCAQLVIDAGQVLLRPNQSGQEIQFFVEKRGASGVAVSGTWHSAGADSVLDWPFYKHFAPLGLEGVLGALVALSFAGPLR